MKIRVVLFLVWIALTACTEHDVVSNSCSVSNPVEDLPWLASKIAELAQSTRAHEQYVVQLQHEGQAVFVFANCCIDCLSVYLVYNCSGDRIGSVGDGEFGEDFRTKGTVIWKGEKSTCNF